MIAPIRLHREQNPKATSESMLALLDVHDQMRASAFRLNLEIPNVSLDVSSITGTVDPTPRLHCAARAMARKLRRTPSTTTKPEVKWAAGVLQVAGDGSAGDGAAADQALPVEPLQAAESSGLAVESQQLPLPMEHIEKHSQKTNGKKHAHVVLHWRSFYRATHTHRTTPIRHTFMHCKCALCGNIDQTACVRSTASAESPSVAGLSACLATCGRRQQVAQALPPCRTSQGKNAKSGDSRWRPF